MAAPIRIAHGLFTWQEPREALEACLRSTAGVVDELIVADGLIDGVDAHGLPWFSDLGWLADADYLPARVPISTKQWRSLSAACDWILATARALRCDWLLYVDADQELHEPQALRDWLRLYRGRIAYPIQRLDRGGFHPCPWQAINIRRVSRYLAGCFVVRLDDGRTVSLSPSVGFGERPAGAPWISHHPEHRPAGRHAHRLGEYETVLEPPPPDCLPYPDPLLLSPLVSGSKGSRYYCPQCGRRYDGPGECSEQHPSTGLERLAGGAGGEPSAGSAPARPSRKAQGRSRAAQAR